MNKQNVLELEGNFTWFWNDKFFIETTEGCFVWSDPSYYGSNELMEYTGSFADYLNEIGESNDVRDMGGFNIKTYCGDNFRFVSSKHH